MGIEEPLGWMVLGNPLKDWAVALAFAVGINVIVAIARWAVAAKLTAAAERSATRFDDALVEAVRSTRQLLVFVVAVYVGSRYLDLPDRPNLFLAGAATLAAFLQVGLWMSRLLDGWIGHYRKRTLETDVGAATSLAALTFIVRVAIWAAILLLALDNLGIDVTAMVAGLGVGGIAVALAVQNILGDVFASLSIVIDKPFVNGDFIIVDNYMGTVENVGLKTTRIRSLDGEQIVFSNGDLLKSRLRNYKRMYERRVVFGFGLTYQSTPEQLEAMQKAVSDIVKAEPQVRLDRAHFAKLAESSLDFEVVYWMLDPDFNKYMDTQQRINLSLLRTARNLGVEFAYPTRTIVVEGMPQLAGAGTEAVAETRALPPVRRSLPPGGTHVRGRS